MAKIVISAFAGEKPLILPRLLPETAATEAVGVRLDDGGLTPINGSLKTGSMIGGDDRTIYRHQNNWLSWPGIVDATPGPVAQDRLYFTGDGVPKMRVGGTVYPLKVPRPTAGAVAAVTGSGTGDVQSRTYVYTYVTSFGEETAPSPGSPIIDWKPGQTVTLNGIEAPPAGRSITLQRIYRSQTGSSGTYLYLIAERAASAANFVDNIAVDAFQEALPSAGWDEPPDALTGITSMPNGMMAAFVGRDVYFCEPWRPHTWPEKYVMSCDSDIVGLASIGSVLLVMTKANPYMMTGSHPDSMQSVKLEANFPCINPRGIVDLGFAICYPSNDGLISVKASGEVSLVTEQLFRRDEWQALSPQTAVGAQHGNIYLLFYDVTLNDERATGALFINVNAAPFLARSSETADAVFFDVESSGLFFKRTGDANVYRFDDPAGYPESYSWRSKEYWLPRPGTFGALLVDQGSIGDTTAAARVAEERARITAVNEATFASGLLNSAINEHVVGSMILNGDAMLPLPSPLAANISIFADGKLVGTANKLGAVCRLPAKNARCWEIAVQSNLPIGSISLATSVNELRG
ncbi:hypothetical protein GGQ73_003017 [Rhizobium skierniewicense]|uniref:Uncharacterized protein n=1 Tax=Rhizobium skierniewicense TaxID=984260 RepID=A0A7W6CAX9_9HYPH|nr:hypothetical protein [Rhizobium skierniewicense]MBB3947053.1 hypothetical protein [Rhizobium skierniewicense]